MSKSLYRLYDDEYMEVVRIMTIEEIMCVVHDVVMALEADRLRDIGPTRLTFSESGIAPPCNVCGEEKGIRPGWKSLEAVKHAMDSAGVGTNGIQSRQDRVDLFGRDQADLYDEAQAYMDGHLHAIAEIMEETGVNMMLAMQIYRMQRLAEHADVEDIDIPDDLGGFGWSA